MTLNSDQLQNVNILKDATLELVKNKFIPNTAANRLKNIIYDDNINAEKFITELRKIVKDSENIAWGQISSRIQDQATQFSAFQMIIFFFILFILFFYRKKIFTKKTKKILSPIVHAIGIRFITVSMYLFSFTSLTATYLRPFTNAYPTIGAMFPFFMIKITYIYNLAPNLISIIYILTLVRCLRLHYPRRRIIRFHMVQGYFYYLFQNLPQQLVELVVKSTLHTQLSDITLYNLNILCLVINLYWLIPGVYQALTLSYPKSSFIREAIEIQVGRDDFNDEDGNIFKWWDQ